MMIVMKMAVRFHCQWIALICVLGACGKSAPLIEFQGVARYESDNSDCGSASFLRTADLTDVTSHCLLDGETLLNTYPYGLARGVEGVPNSKEQIFAGLMGKAITTITFVLSSDGTRLDAMTDSDGFFAVRIRSSKPIRELQMNQSTTELLVCLPKLDFMPCSAKSRHSG
jgi:hypothetical protein